MLTIKEKGLLLAIIKHCNKINEKIVGLKQEQFNRDDDVVQIICFNILNIGELAKHFDDEFINQYNEVPWDKIKGMRDRVAHGYDTIDLDRVWNTVLYDINPLLNYCKKILKDDEK